MARRTHKELVRLVREPQLCKVNTLDIADGEKSSERPFTEGSKQEHRRYADDNQNADPQAPKNGYHLRVILIGISQWNKGCREANRGRTLSRRLPRGLLHVQ